MTTPERKLRCRFLETTRRGSIDRCENEALSDYGLCFKHLAGAAAEFRVLTEASGDGR